MKKLIIIILISSIPVIGLGQKRVAVSPTTGTADMGVKNAIMEALLDGISNSGYTIVERANFSEIIKELEFQASGFVDDAQFAEIGRAAGAEYVCISSVNKIGYNYQISYRLVDVATGTVVGKDKKSANESTIIEVIDAISKEKLFSSTKTENTVFACGLEIQKNDSGEQYLDELKQNNICPPGWRLPTLSELKCLCAEKERIGNFNYGDYWSSYREKKYGMGVKLGSCTETHIIDKASVRCVRDR